MTDGEKINLWVICPQCGAIRAVSKDNLEVRKVCACPDCNCLFNYMGNVPMIADGIYSTMLIRDGRPIQNRKDNLQ
jgi:hypothetical protein